MMAGVPSQQKIINTCEAEFNAYSNDCSSFVKAVANDLGIVLAGQANQIVDAIQQAPWTKLAGGADAKGKADRGFFVIGGLKDTPNGHVVVVVQGHASQGRYPSGYWGRLGGTGKKNTTINWAWDKDDRDKVIYAYRPLPSK